MFKYVITEPCIDVKDGSCVDVCPVDCIHTDGDAPQYYIHPDDCISCSACVDVCPVDAIYRDDELPERYESYIKVNAEYFDLELDVDRMNALAEVKAVRARASE